MKFVEYDGATHFEEIEVLEVASVDSAAGKIYYPTKARKTLILPPQCAARYELTVHEFKPNVAPDTDAFTFVFPVGTTVTDKILNCTYIIGEGGTTIPTQPVTQTAPATSPSEN